MELSEYFRFVLALAFVLGLIGLLALVAKRYGPGMARVAMTKGRKKRLRLVETMVLDGKRRAIIFRRDDTEHLVILGPNSETVVETGITPPPEDDNQSNTEGQN
ncbi:MAG: flagellar biosynthetic protein FliO [Rhodospirillaceae bacterium]|nr:flagellar biosynthetic protein FliO [Rhodospirillaceae bacterium]